MNNTHNKPDSASSPKNNRRNREGGVKPTSYELQPASDLKQN